MALDQSALLDVLDALRTGDVTVGLRYGATGRPEQESAATNNPPARYPR